MYEPAIFGLLTNPKLLDAIEAIIGPEITVNPVNVVRVKVPERRLPGNRNFHVGLTATWWHQDQGVYSDDISDDHRNAASCVMHQIEDAQTTLSEGGAS